MFIGNTYIIPAVSNLPGQKSVGPAPPPPGNFIALETALTDIMALETGLTDKAELEQ
tara:strand:- start:317 stop:487 length:171 start_codon:yes stop_codon:yes gene_type:complete